MNPLDPPSRPPSPPPPPPPPPSTPYIGRVVFTQETASDASAESPTEDTVSTLSESDAGGINNSERFTRSTSIESLNMFEKSGVEFALPMRRVVQKPEGVCSLQNLFSATFDLHSEKDTAEQESIEERNHLTIDVAPDIDFYKKSCGQRKRPSIHDLIDGVSIEKARLEEKYSQELEQKISVAVPTSPERKKFGWIEGVFVRCLQNIIGVILFIRLSWVAAHCGILLGIVVILLATAVTIVTTVSLSAICTNGEVKGGGLYYLISRSLGPEFGGSIGVMFAFGNAISGALYIVGLSETVVSALKAHGITIIDGGINDTRIIALCVAFVLMGIIFIGISFESVLQKALLIPFLASVSGYLIGSLLPISSTQVAKGMIGWSYDTIADNLLPRFTQGQSFFSVFAVYFPAATGIMAGANISGDLKHPQTAIPKGTMLAIVVSTMLYILTLIVAASTFVRDADGSGILNAVEALPCAANSTCEYGMYNYFQVLTTMSFWPPLIVIGIISSTLSSALASMVSAPKIFQAVCRDKLFPLITGMGKGYGNDDAPRRIYGLTFAITCFMIIVGDLNAIAPIISNFFLAAYTLVNYACFDASFSGSPGWRPAFKFYSMWVSLVGAIVCIFIMFTMNWITALLTFIVFVLIFAFLKYRKPDVNWGSSTTANHYKQTLTGMHRLMKADDHVKNYRPQILVLSYRGRRDLAVFANSITRGSSLIVFANIVLETPSYRLFSSLSKADAVESSWLRSEGVKAFPISFATTEGLTKGAEALFQTVGLGKLRPNIVLMGFKTDWLPTAGQSAPSVEQLKAVNEYFGAIQIAFDRLLGVAVLRSNEHCQNRYLRQESKVDFDASNSSLKAALKKRIPRGASVHAEKPQELSVTSFGDSCTKNYFPRVKRAIIDVWWLADDGGLTLLLPHLLTLPKSYLAGAQLRVFSLTSSGTETNKELGMAALLSKFRIDFKDLIIISDVSTQPKEETHREFLSLIAPFRGDEENGLISDVMLSASSAKTNRHLRLAELLREKSRSSDLVVMTLPVPRRGAVCATLYMSWLEMLTKEMPSTLLVRGNQTDVLTFYS